MAHISYTKTTWVDDTTPLDEDNLNNIEGGIETATTAINSLDDRITNLESLGRFLSPWSCPAGLPTTEPTTPLPYLYKPGDWFIVSAIAPAGGTNYRPTGSSYTGVPSTVVETEDVSIGSIYIYNGTIWSLNASAKEITIAQVIGLTEALAAKQNVLTAGWGIGLNNNTIRLNLATGTPDLVLYKAPGSPTNFNTVGQLYELIKDYKDKIVQITHFSNNPETYYVKGVSKGGTPTFWGISLLRIDVNPYKYWFNYSGTNSSTSIPGPLYASTYYHTLSEVKGSASGTSTSEIQYLTIDGVEYKIGGSLSNVPTLDGNNIFTGTNTFSSDIIIGNDTLQNKLDAKSNATNIRNGTGTNSLQQVNCSASGVNSFAEGSLTIANGLRAHAEGYMTKANGVDSHASGNNTIAGYFAQSVVGKYNDNKSNTLFEVGNGTSENARSNAFEVLTDGTIKIQGNLTDGTNSVSVANIVTTSTAQTISGEKTFSDEITINNELNVSSAVHTEQIICDAQTVNVEEIPQLNGINTWSETNTFKLGTTFKHANDIIYTWHIGDGVIPGSPAYLAVSRNNTPLYYFSGNAFAPQISNKDLGSSDNKWKDLYLGGNLYVDDLNKIQDPEGNPIVANAIATIKSDSYQKVDTTVYPTLESFLASTGQEGIQYLYPKTYEGETVTAYYKYIWEGSAWVSLGTTDGGTYIDAYTKTQSDARYVNLTDAQTKAGVLTLTHGLKTTEIQNGSGAGLYITTSGQQKFITPRSNGDTDLGTSAVKWKDFYLSGNISDGTNSVSVADISGSLMTMEAWTSTTLTDEQIAKIIKGVIVKSDTNIPFAPWPTDIYLNAVLYPAVETSTVYRGFICSSRFQNGHATNYIGVYEINKSTKLIRKYDTIAIDPYHNLSLYTLNSINSKSIPSYPSSTGTFVLKCVNGTLTWVEE